MKKIFSGIALVSIALGLTTCKNDLDILAPYKEIPSIYAVLTPQDNIQMIRVNKVFLGEGNALNMAKIADSINYKPGELTVTLEHYVGGTKSASAGANGGPSEIVFRDSVITANPGAFNTTQRVYVSNVRLKTSGEYKLIVKNNTSGSVYTAKSVVLDSVSGNSFPPFVPPYYKLTPSQIALYNPGDPNNLNSVYIDYSLPNGNYSYRIITVPNAKIYESRVRVHYEDSTSGAIAGKGYMDFVAGLNSVTEIKAGQAMNFNFKGSMAYEGYKKDLEERKVPFGGNLTGRLIRYVEFIVTCAGQDYSDYLQYAAPSISIAQDKPLYTNFTGGAYGLFAFRSRCSVKKEILTTYVNALASDKNLCNYKFLNASKVWPGCP